MAELTVGPLRVPHDLSSLRPLERGLVLLALQESTDEDYPTELFDELRTSDDCWHYLDVKRGRR